MLMQDVDPVKICRVDSGNKVCPTSQCMRDRGLATKYGLKKMWLKHSLQTQQQTSLHHYIITIASLFLI